MVRKLFLVSLTILAIFSLEAKTEISGGLDLAGVYIANDKSNSTMSYLANGYAGIKASSSAMKAELKGSFSVSNIASLSFSLDKANVRARFPSFGSNKLTLMIGKAPISWGIGYYYRIGDVMLDKTYSHNLEAGVSDSRNMWLLHLSQGLGAGFSSDIAFSIPLEGQIERVGANIKKNFSSDYIKEIILYYSYDKEKNHKAALAFDLFAFFDITLGLESSFRTSDDIRCAINFMKPFAISTEEKSYSFVFYLASNLDFHEEQYNVFSALTFSPNQRTSLMLSLENGFSNGGYENTTIGLSLSFLALDELKAKCALAYNYYDASKTNSVAGTIKMEASF